MIVIVPGTTGNRVCQDHGTLLLSFVIINDYSIVAGVQDCTDI